MYSKVRKWVIHLGNPPKFCHRLTLLVYACISRLISLTSVVGCSSAQSSHNSAMSALCENERHFDIPVGKVVSARKDICKGYERPLQLSYLLFPPCRYCESLEVEASLANLQDLAVIVAIHPASGVSETTPTWLQSRLPVGLHGERICAL